MISDEDRVKIYNSKTQINVPTFEKCKGCKGLYKIKVKPNGNVECVFTKVGISHIPNCPCFDCIVKPICTHACPVLADVVNKSGVNIAQIEGTESKG